jgi:hypothetical protein
LNGADGSVLFEKLRQDLRRDSSFLYPSGKRYQLSLEFGNHLVPRALRVGISVALG